MKSALFRTFTLLLCLLALPAFAAEEAPALEPQSGPGDLLVSPTRIVLEGRTRAADIVLNNRGSKEATYRISLAHLRMDETGSYKEITEEEAKSSLPVADALVRYSPRQVTLKPGESQVVKVLLRKPEGLADGEYISHMLFRAVPDLPTGEDVEATATNTDKIAIKLIPVYGVSIPVIVRSGDLAAQAKLGNARLENNTLSLSISRTGNRSVFGDIIVTQAGSKNVVGQLRGTGVLAYNSKRNVSLPVTAGAPLTIEYREREEDGGTVLDKLQVQ